MCHVLFAKEMKKIRQIWPQQLLKHFTAGYRGFPPCTQSQYPINRETGYSNVLVSTAPLDSTAASTALTTSALASALAPAFPSSMRSMLTHTPTHAVSVHEPQDELLADLPDPPYVPAGGERARKRRGSNLPTPHARRARLSSGSHTDFLIN